MRNRRQIAHRFYRELAFREDWTEKATDIKEAEGYAALIKAKEDHTPVKFDDHPILNIYRPTRKNRPI